MANQAPQRFDLLDGLRGIAAVAVMLYHYSQHNGLHWLRGAWVAVDLFFILSGFVIAHSYGAKILAGMDLRQFVLVRYLRLGPLYLLGLVIGLVAAWLVVARPDNAGLTHAQVLKAFALGLVWLPYFNEADWPIGTDVIGDPAFPLNDPAWSLFFEFFVNLLFFAFVLRVRKTSSAWLVALALAVTVFCALALGKFNPGWGRWNFVYGFPRVVAEFFLGALIHALGLHRQRPRVALAALVGLFALLGFASGPLAFANSMTLIPLTVVLFAAVPVSGLGRSVCQVLGDLSYPLYILHVPIYRFAFETTPIGAVGPVGQIVILGGTSIAAALALAPLDLRFRRWLMGRLTLAAPRTKAT